jgi:hypothetical protein
LTGTAAYQKAAAMISAGSFITITGVYLIVQGSQTHNSYIGTAFALAGSLLMLGGLRWLHMAAVDAAYDRIAKRVQFGETIACNDCNTRTLTESAMNEHRHILHGDS